MQNVMHIATNAGHTMQNDVQTMQNDSQQCVMLAAWGAPYPYTWKNFSI